MSTNDGYIPITELTIVSVKSMCAHTFIPSFLINFAVTLMLTWIWIAFILYYDTILYCDGLCIELCNVVFYIYNIVLIFVLFLFMCTFEPPTYFAIIANMTSFTITNVSLSSGIVIDTLSMIRTSYVFNSASIF